MTTLEILLAAVVSAEEAEINARVECYVAEQTGEVPSHVMNAWVAARDNLYAAQDAVDALAR